VERPTYTVVIPGGTLISEPLRRNGKANPHALLAEYWKEKNPERKIRIQQALEGLGYVLIKKGQTYRQYRYTSKTYEDIWRKESEVELISTPKSY
jgi:hypothetical protein